MSSQRLSYVHKSITFVLRLFSFSPFIILETILSIKNTCISFPCIVTLLTWGWLNPVLWVYGKNLNTLWSGTYWKRLSKMWCDVMCGSVMSSSTSWHTATLHPPETNMYFVGFAEIERRIEKSVLLTIQLTRNSFSNGRNCRLIPSVGCTAVFSKFVDMLIKWRQLLPRSVLLVNTEY